MGRKKVEIIENNNEFTSCRDGHKTGGEPGLVLYLMSTQTTTFQFDKLANENLSASFVYGYLASTDRPDKQVTRGQAMSALSGHCDTNEDKISKDSDLSA